MISNNTSYKQKGIYLSIIIPCYNEGDKVKENIHKIMNFMKTSSILNLEKASYEIIVVDDGSKDNTKNILVELKEKVDNKIVYPNLEIINLQRNMGKGEAVKTGISNSSGELVLFMDADLSTDLKAINDALKIHYDYNEKYDAIIASRRHKDSILVKKQRFFRRFIGKCCSILTNIIVPLNCKDTQCGFKMFKGSLIRDVISKQAIKGFAFDVELLYIIKLNGGRVTEFGVKWENDEDSKVNPIKSSIKFFIDLVKIRTNKQRYYLKEVKTK